jgi:DNA-binding winged helix-turn-helix (wHTH) protein
MLDLSSATAQEGEGRDGGVAFFFGRYQLLPDRRLLLAGEQPVELKSRAFDVLLTLVRARGTLVTRDRLSKCVWPTTVVDPHNLDIQISTLRKALGSDRDLILTDAGRGYRLATAVNVIRVSTATGPTTNVPAPLGPLVGRETEVSELLGLVAKRRLVTLTGPGGIGKTRLGLAIGQHALAHFADGVWIAELAPFVDSELVPSTVARALRIELGSNRTVVDQLVAALQCKHLLLVIDNCEHLVGAVAQLVETLLRGAANLHILATSREPL